MTMIVAEVGLAHHGDLQEALAYVEAVAAAGADAVKFQCHTGDDNHGIRRGLWLPQDCDRQAYWVRTAFKPQEWKTLRFAAYRIGIKFGVSCFSAAGWEKMSRVDPDFWKIPAGVEENACYHLSRPTFASHDFWTDPLAHSSRAVCARRSGGAVVHVRSEYPTPIENVGVRWLSVPECCGLSSHCPHVEASYPVFAMRAVYLEHHVTWSRNQRHPDASSSITIEELAQLVKFRNLVAKSETPRRVEFDHEELSGEFDA